MNSILITGANRGIGLEFVKQLSEAKSPPKFVFAGCRNPDGAKDLKEVAQKHPNVKILKIDVGDEASYKTAVQAVTSEVGDEGLNVLFNVAGILHIPKFHDVTADLMRNEYETNAIGPLMITQAFYPLLQKAAIFSKAEKLGCSRAAVLNMTSGLSVISDNKMGGMYPYRASKAALNMITKSMSVDFKSDNILAVSIEPGWVSTDMGGANASITPTQCVSALLDVMAKLGETENGRVVSWKGKMLEY